MLFNTAIFFSFLIIAWSLYRLLSFRSQNLLLLFASYFFYGWWDWRFLSLLWLSTIVDYFCGRLLPVSKNKKKILAVSIFTNLGILFAFKYYNFFIESASNFLELFGFQSNFPFLEIVLPLGISFYTFQTLAYTIDIYRGKSQPEYNFISFALYVTYFPQLVAGPIERAGKLLPQINQNRVITQSNLAAGFQLMVTGYVKKVFIADGVSPVVDKIFFDPQGFSGITLLTGVYLFALQIYGDFSGYTDIARGTSRLFGIELGRNFRQPYLAPNITEFWRRWHISLSTWLRDYLYISLGGNRVSRFRTQLNLMITMLLGGLWHGASWNFFIWGGLHGTYLIAHKVVIQTGKKFSKYPNQFYLPGQFVGVFFTFNLVCLTWVFFRAESLAQATSILENIFSLNPGTDDPLAFLYLAIFGGFVFLTDLLTKRQDQETVFPQINSSWLRGFIYAFFAYLALCVGTSNIERFIYFQF